MNKPLADMSEFELQIYDEIQLELRTSRYWDCTGKKVTRDEYDLGELLRYATAPERATWGMLEAAWRVLQRVDTTAMRYLATEILHAGCNKRMREICVRILANCNAIDTAVWLGWMWNRESGSEEAPNAAH